MLNCHNSSHYELLFISSPDLLFFVVFNLIFWLWVSLLTVLRIAMMYQENWIFIFSKYSLNSNDFNDPRKSQKSKFSMICDSFYEVRSTVSWGSYFMHDIITCSFVYIQCTHFMYLAVISQLMTLFVLT